MAFGVLHVLTFFAGSVHVFQGQLHFGDNYDFILTASETIFRPGDNVTLKCLTAAGESELNGARDLVFPDRKGVLWERNGQSLFTTIEENGKCHVRSEMRFRRPVLTEREMNTVTCKQEKDTVSVAIVNVTVSATGERWVCSQFPFLKSNPVLLSNYAPITSVILTIEDHFPDDVTTGILMTLRCISSFSNPEPLIKWQFKKNGKTLPLPEQSSLAQRVDRLGRIATLSELSLPAVSLYNESEVTCQASNDLDNVTKSNQEKISTSRSPVIRGLTAQPSNYVIRGSNVTLTCAAHGHPAPSIKWTKKGSFLPGGVQQLDSSDLHLYLVSNQDQGEYVCTASNGVASDDVNSIFVKVEEPSPSTTVTTSTASETVHDKAYNVSVSVTVSETASNVNSNIVSLGGTIAASVVCSLVFVAVIVGAAVWLLYKRKQKGTIPSPPSSNALFRIHASSSTPPRPDIYVARPSVRHLNSPDSLSHYLDLPPAPRPPISIGNKGYGLSPKQTDDIINYKRSLPTAPGTLEDSRDAGDSGYDEICDVIPTGNTALADYEVPVLLEEEEEAESIYDVHPDWFNQIQHPMGRVVTSNMGPLSTQM